MKEQKQIILARELCKKYNLKYRIKNDGLFILCDYGSGKHYIQVCYNLLNVDSGSIKGILLPLKEKVFNGCVYI